MAEGTEDYKKLYEDQQAELEQLRKATAENHNQAIAKLYEQFNIDKAFHDYLDKSIDKTLPIEKINEQIKSLVTANPKIVTPTATGGINTSINNESQGTTTSESTISFSGGFDPQTQKINN